MHISAQQPGRERESSENMKLADGRRRRKHDDSTGELRREKIAKKKIEKRRVPLWPTDMCCCNLTFIGWPCWAKATDTLRSRSHDQPPSPSLALCFLLVFSGFYYFPTSFSLHSRDCWTRPSVACHGIVWALEHYCRVADDEVSVRCTSISLARCYIIRMRSHLIENSILRASRALQQLKLSNLKQHKFIFHKTFFFVVRSSTMSSHRGRQHVKMKVIIFLWQWKNFPYILFFLSWNPIFRCCRRISLLFLRYSQMMMAVDWSVFRQTARRLVCACIAQAHFHDFGMRRERVRNNI